MQEAWFTRLDECTREEISEYERLKLSVWAFLDIFENLNGFSMGDARAYLSAMSDLIVIEQGLKYVEALSEALRWARKVYEERGVEGLAKEAEKVFQKWRSLDREKLKRDLLGYIPKEAEVRAEKRCGLSVVSLFTGAYGLDLGFEYAGFEVAVALDISEDSYCNLRANRPKVPFLLGDIKEFTTQDILREAGLKPGEVDVVTGGPPCQPFSPAGKRQSLGDPRAAPIVDFVRVVKEAKPKVFVMEEVPGILSARIKHVPIRERGTRTLAPEEEPGSAWRVVLQLLQGTGYRITWNVLNSADYGTPQVRERVIVIGVRADLGKNPILPHPVRTRRLTLVALKPWLTLLDAIADVENHIGYTPLPPKYAKFIKFVPPGGNWRQIPDSLKPEAMKGAYNAGGGRMGFYRRLTWFEPSPTLVTSPAMKATMIVHPWEDRPLSVGEYLRLQGFPDDWKIVVPIDAAYRLFGEAVPVQLAYAIAKTVKAVITS